MVDVHGKRVTVVGMGRTALALTRLLLREGARPFVTDSAKGPNTEAFARELDELGVPHEYGRHSAEAFADAALVVPSPGVPPAIAPISAAREAGADVIGEMEFAFSRCQSRVLAITGTNGKTTTTALLAAMIGACGKSVVLAGNNDMPFSAAVMLDPAPAYIVLEVSSYQLETARTFRPWIGAVLNVTPDHLARHGTVEQYAAIKARLFENQTTNDTAVVNHDNSWTRDMKPPDGVERLAFSMVAPVDNGVWLDGDVIRFNGEPVASVSDNPLPGRHNLANVLAALAMARAGGFAWDTVLDGLHRFAGVEHRIERVAVLGGVAFYNDSKSTNIDSLRVALDSFEQPIVLIAGGQGKGADYEPLAELITTRVRHLVVIGEDAPKLEAAFGRRTPTSRAESMDDAVRQAAATAKPGDVVLLSPACASFDMYRDFEHRGRVFKECVAAYGQEPVLTAEGRNAS